MYSELNTGNRSQGGQRKRYKDTLHESLKQCFIRLQTWEVQALDRKNWRTVVHQGTAIFEQQQRQKREHKRLLRKNRELCSVTHPPVNDSSNICPHCGKLCRSRIGLVSHLRTHNL